MMKNVENKIFGSKIDDMLLKTMQITHISIVLSKFNQNFDFVLGAISIIEEHCGVEVDKKLKEVAAKKSEFDKKVYEQNPKFESNRKIAYETQNIRQNSP